MAPTSQKYRPITVIGPGGECTLNIRPEDLTWTEPVRVNAVQTLGAAWVDAFGPGLAQIVIAGHTGWSGGPSGGPDWEAQFQQLYACAFKDWNDQVEATKDPEGVEMLFVDTLDGRAARVAPKTFVLRRNKSRPLLVQYNITFLVVRMLGDGGGAGGNEDSDPDGILGYGSVSQAAFDQAQESMSDSVDAMSGMAA